MHITSPILRELLKGNLLKDPNYRSLYPPTNRGTVLRLTDCQIDDITLSEDFIYEYDLELRNCKFLGNFSIMAGSFKKIDIQQ